MHILADESVGGIIYRLIGQHIQHYAMYHRVLVLSIGHRTHVAFQVIAIEQSLKTAKEKKMFRNLILFGTMSGIAGRAASSARHPFTPCPILCTAQLLCIHFDSVIHGVWRYMHAIFRQQHPVGQSPVCMAGMLCTCLHFCSTNDEHAVT